MTIEDKIGLSFRFAMQVLESSALFEALPEKGEIIISKKDGKLVYEIK